jgi:NADH-quinone oxidoreductase subunit L
MLIGWLAISGVPIFAGFFSKDEILWKTWSASAFGLPSTTFSKLLWAIGALTALLTAIYMTRMMIMTFWGEERFRQTPAEHHDAEDHHGPVEPHESPWIMTVPLIVLAVLSTIGGFIGVPYALSSVFTDKDVNVIEHALEPVVASVPAASHTPIATHEAAGEGTHGAPGAATSAAHAVHSAEEISAERILAAVSVLIGLLGIGVGWVVFKARPLLQMPRLLENKYYVDEIYDATLIRPIKTTSREVFWQIIDIGVIDGFLHSIGEAVTEAGRLGRYLQAGFVRGYAAIILAGALILIGLFAFSAFRL